MPAPCPVMTVLCTRYNPGGFSLSSGSKVAEKSSLVSFGKIGTQRGKKLVGGEIVEFEGNKLLIKNN